MKNDIIITREQVRTKPSCSDRELPELVTGASLCIPFRPSRMLLFVCCLLPVRIPCTHSVLTSSRYLSGSPPDRILPLRNFWEPFSITF